jgi:hypothetical protein
LHGYEIAHRRYGVPNDDDDWPGAAPLIAERRVRLKPLIESGLRRFTYQYDFGDNSELADPRHEEHAQMLARAGGAVACRAQVFTILGWQAMLVPSEAATLTV